MIAEILVLVFWMVTGTALLFAWRMDAAGAAIAGWLAGLCLYVVAGVPLLLAGLLAHVGITFGVSALVTALAVWRAGRPLAEWKALVLPGAIALGVIIAATLLAHTFHLVKWHNDSFRYLQIGALIDAARFGETPNAMLALRLVTLPLLHAPANLSGDIYLRALSPLTAASAVMLTAWLFAQARGGLSGMVRDGWGLAALALALLVLVTTNRFVWHGFYINGHLLFGVLMLAIAGAGFVMARRPEADHRALWALQLVCVPVLVWLRPEGFLGAALAIAPTLVIAGISWRYRSVLLAVLGVSMLVWQGYLTGRMMMAGNMPPLRAFVPVVLGAVCILGAPLLAVKMISQRPLALMGLMEASAAALLAFVVLRDPARFAESWEAIAHNLGGSGAWGYAPVLYSLLVVFVMAGCREQAVSWLRAPLIASACLYLAIPALRNNPFRIGEGDTLNRMAIQLIPLAVLLIAIAAASRQWGWPWSRSADSGTVER